VGQGGARGHRGQAVGGCALLAAGDAVAWQGRGVSVQLAGGTRRLWGCLLLVLLVAAISEGHVASLLDGSGSD